MPVMCLGYPNPPVPLGLEKQLGRLPFRTCLVVPAHDERQVVPYLLESLILGIEALGVARDVRLLLDVQVLDLPQDGRELWGSRAGGAVSSPTAAPGSPQCQHPPLC